MSTQSLVVVGRYIVNTFDYSQTLEEIHYEAQEGSDKRQRQQGSFNRIHNDS